MPYKSERQEFLSDLSRWIALASVEDSSSASSSSESSDGDEAVDLFFLSCASRFLSTREPRRRPVHFFLDSFSMIADAEFRQLFRTSRQGFVSLFTVLESHPVFSNSSQCSRTAPAWRLALTLCRLGVNGNGASVGKMQAIFGVGAGTVCLFTNRVIEAILAQFDGWLEWPAAGRRRELARVMQEEGFLGYVGFIDGTTLPLSQKPGVDGKVYVKEGIPSTYKLFAILTNESQPCMWVVLVGVRTRLCFIG